MNLIKMYLKESGETAELYKDFNLYKGCYHNSQISVYVPKSLLYQGTDFINAVKIGAILTAPNGAKITTVSYYLNYVKDEIYNGKDYAVYTRLLPKEFTVYSGTQTLVANVVSADNSDALNLEIISVTTSQTAPLVVLESAYLDLEQPIEPSQVEIIEGEINSLAERTTRLEEKVQDIDEAVEYAEKSAEESAQSASAAQSASESAANSLAEALNAAKSAEEYAEIAKQYAEFGIKINTDYQTVESLPRPGDLHYIYLIPNGSTGANGYDEYIWVEDKNDYEKIGTTEIDLTAYATKEEVNALGEQLNTNKADKNGTYPDMTVGNAENATALQTPRAIDGVMFDGTKNIAHYAICSTSSQEEIKIVTFPAINNEEFQLVVGARITVHFTTFNSVGSPSLNVNGTGAKPVVCKGRKTDLVWNSFTHITFLYDGSNWVILDGYPLADKPVGTHHVQFDGENTPAALFGGTWTLDTEYINRVLLGAGIYALGATGGSADAVLVEHGYHTPGQTYGFPDGSDNSYCLLAEKLLADGYALKFSTTRPFMLYTGDELGIRTISQGESGAGKNMMPYKVVNIWVRTA